MSTANELSLIPEIENPAELFRPGGLDPILAAIEAKVREMELDASTDRGRKASRQWPARSHRRRPISMTPEK